ncbi:MAG: adenylate/guanylate cyclase domain-containing protein [Desulfobacteraceae bacterium]|nr:MAG: adenylate/guanylate cyclase domain-containing protein [Desulfobacteraceae bacterium]
MKRPLLAWIERLGSAGSLDIDTPDERLQKAILVFLASIYCIAGILWAVAYLALGLVLPAIIPLCYSLVSGASLLLFFRTKLFRFFRFVQLLLILLLPFLLQVSLGGFQASSTVMIWSILAPIGALMFAGTGHALRWFFAYLALMIVSGMLEGKPNVAPIPPLIKILFFIMNIGGVSTIFYVLLQYFVREGEQAMAALDLEHHRVIREKERLDKIKKVMANFVPETMKSIIEKNPEEIHLDRYIQEATVLFLDIEGFTTLLQSYSTERITRVIETYFSMFYDIIQKYGGDINETAGDGMMVIFLEHDAAKRSQNAIRAALEIRDCCSGVPREEDPDLFPIQVNIGICSGEVHIGPTKIRGAKGDRWTFTASGSVTVMAARLSDYANGGQILVGGGTARLVEKLFAMKPLGKIELKNFKHPVDVFQVT